MLPFELASGDLREQLVAAAVAGHKTATTALKVSYDLDGEALPTPGLYRLLDRQDESIGVVEVTEVELRRIADVDDAIARAEGEGFRDAAAWRRGHEQFWRSTGEIDRIRAHRPGFDLDDALVVIEWFRWRPELLATGRLLLRPFTTDDAEPFAAMNADPEVMKYIRSGPLDRASSDAMLDRLMNGFATEGFGLGAVERVDDGAVLGFTGLHRHPWYPGDVEVGWRLTRDAWGGGYATEAATAWIRRAFGLLELPRLISITFPENVRSIAVMHRLGFTEWERATHDGLDVVVYARDR